MPTESQSVDEMLVNPALIEAGHIDPFIQEESKLTLSELIPRIISERGSILHVTEESLAAEIKNLEENESNEDDSQFIMSNDVDEDIANTDEDHQLQQPDNLSTEDSINEKNEILTLLRSALNESSLSLDFISLLISCVRPAAGSISMSPHLKQNVPMGSLNSAQIDIQEAAKEQMKQDYEHEAKVGQGWKLQSLSYSARALKDSSVRLTEEILKEKEYWNHICNIVNSNEVLIKMNNGSSKDIGVKYGFGDSGSNYFDKGVGILKKNVKNGEVQFKFIRNNNLEKTYKIVKLKILKRVNDELTVVSETNIKSFFNSSIQNNDNSIGSEITKARFYLFEEELFHELVKEATTLLPYQVQVMNNKILAEINDEIIEIEAVSLEDYENNEEVQERPISTKADYISSFLRLMLSQHHKQNISQKFRTPAPLKQDQRHLQKVDPKKPALLLRPLIGHSRHNYYIKQVCKICESLIEKHAQADDSNKAFLKIIKYTNIEAKEYEKNKFIRSTKVPNSKVIFEINSATDPTTRLRFEISILNTSNFCNILMNVKSFVVGQDKKLMDVDFSEFIDVEDSLNWSIISS